MARCGPSAPTRVGSCSRECVGGTSTRRSELRRRRAYRALMQLWLPLRRDSASGPSPAQEPSGLIFLCKSITYGRFCVANCTRCIDRDTHAQVVSLGRPVAAMRKLSCRCVVRWTHRSGSLMQRRAKNSSWCRRFGQVRARNVTFGDLGEHSVT